MSYGEVLEVVITAPTRNRLGGSSRHVGSNPTLSAILLSVDRPIHTGKHHAIVTGDQAMLWSGGYRGIRILSLKNFLDAIKIVQLEGTK